MAEHRPAFGTVQSRRETDRECYRPMGSAAGKQASAPYEVEQLQEARAKLEQLADGSIANLEQFQPFRGQEPTHVIRQHDLHSLFSTEPDLAGGFTDISAYVRDTEGDTSVYIFWREKPGKDEPAPYPDEICPVPVER